MANAPASSPGRTAKVSRQTKETKVELSVDLDGRGRGSAHTGVGFFDHMLDLLGRHSLIDLDVTAEGDLQVDSHHTVEDVGIVLGQAIDKALGDKRGIHRYGWAIVPMDETLAQVAVDLSGRPAFVYRRAVHRPADRHVPGRTGRGVLEIRRDHRADEPARLGPLRHQQPPHRRGDFQSRRESPETGRQPRPEERRRAQHEGLVGRLKAGTDETRGTETAAAHKTLSHYARCPRPAARLT